MNSLFCLCAKVAILVGSPMYKSDMLRLTPINYYNYFSKKGVRILGL